MWSLRLPTDMGCTISGAASHPQMSSRHRGHHRSYPGCAGGVLILAAPVESVFSRPSEMEASFHLSRRSCSEARAAKGREVGTEYLRYVICPSRYRARRLCPEAPDVLSARPWPTEIGRLDPKYDVPSAQVFSFLISHATRKGEMQRRAKADICFLIALARWSSSKHVRVIGPKPAKRCLRFGLGRYVICMLRRGCQRDSIRE